MIIISIAFYFWILRNTLFWVALWQLKEYRFDRLFVHIRDTKQGRNILFSPILFCKILLIFGYIYALFLHNNLLPYQIAVSATFLIQGFFVSKDFFLRTIKRPVWTYKAILLIFITLFFVVVFFSFPIIYEMFLWMLIVDRLIPFIVAFFVFLLSFPTDFYQEIQVRRAIKKMQTYKKLTVIGVTGSYGKSSTKDYIAQVLGGEFRVVKTKGTNNTPIGIANTILNDLKPNTEIFVVEMGAYKIGEIMQMCEIVKPKIGVLTAVNDQHLSMFGSLQNTMKAKYELTDSLPKNGLAIFNGNNSNAYALYKKTKKQKAVYVCQKNIPADISANNVVVEKNQITFDVTIKKEKMHLKTPFIGGYNIENILPAIYLANHLGMDSEKIKRDVSHLSSLPKTMQRHEMGGVSIIDDTFNANPQAVLAALDYMKIYKAKKIMVLQPMIELGKEGENEHYKAGKAMSNICDLLFLTNNNFYSAIIKGVADGGGKCLVNTGSLNQLAKLINANAKKGDIVVFEGKEAGIVLDKIL